MIIINVSGNNNIKILYISSHLYYIFNEILKNSIVSMSNNNINDEIKITLTETKDFINIKISDKGLGFNIKNINKIMSYSYSTTKII